MSVVTVTTTTVVVASATSGIAVALGAVGTCILISVLIARELSTSYESSQPLIEEQLKSLTSSFNIVIVPMLMVFALIVAVKVLEALA